MPTTSRLEYIYSYSENIYFRHSLKQLHSGNSKDVTVAVTRLFQMAEPTIQQLFGATATQDATSLTIQKSDLIGLTASATNTAESLLAGLVARWAAKQNVANQAANPEQNITAVPGFDSIAYRTIGGTSTAFYQKVINITLQSVNRSEPIDPNAY